MARFTGLLLIVLAGMGAVLWAVQSPDEITFQGPGFEGSTSRVALALIALVLGAVIAAAWWAIVWAWDLPARIARTARRLQTRRTHDAIADGLLAVEAEDAAAAQRAAARLNRSASAPPGVRKLTLLLKARALETAEDWVEAERAWSDLAREPGAELAGLKGLALSAARRGDGFTAAAHARTALSQRSHAAWAYRTLLDLQLAASDWTGALQTLDEGEKRALVEAPEARRRRAVLLTVAAVRTRTTSVSDAEHFAAEAVKLAPGFPPAPYFAARIALAAGRANRAQSALEAGWKARPHPALSIAWLDLRPRETPRDAARRMRTLAELNPDHRESRILIGEAAIAEGDWMTAAEALAPLLELGATARLCTLMEAVARGQGALDDARRWARVAASAAREPDWSDVEPERRAFSYSNAEWARLVGEFGVQGALIHTRYEAFSGDLEALSQVVLTTPQTRIGIAPTTPVRTPPAGRRRTSGTQVVGPVRPPAPDYAPDE